MKCAVCLDRFGGWGYRGTPYSFPVNWRGSCWGRLAISEAVVRMRIDYCSLFPLPFYSSPVYPAIPSINSNRGFHGFHPLSSTIVNRRRPRLVEYMHVDGGRRAGSRSRTGGGRFCRSESSVAFKHQSREFRTG